MEMLFPVVLTFLFNSNGIGSNIPTFNSSTQVFKTIQSAYFNYFMYLKSPVFPQNISQPYGADWIPFSWCEESKSRQ